MNSGSVNAYCDLLLTAIDLTRACCANDNYFLGFRTTPMHAMALPELQIIWRTPLLLSKNKLIRKFARASTCLMLVTIWPMF